MKTSQLASRTVYYTRTVAGRWHRGSLFRLNFFFEECFESFRISRKLSDSVREFFNCHLVFIEVEPTVSRAPTSAGRSWIEAKGPRTRGYLNSGSLLM